MSVQPQNNNLNYLIDQTFTKFNRLFVLPFERIEESNVQKYHRDSFLHCCVPNIEIKDFNVLIDGKGFFDFPFKKNEKEAYENIMEQSNNNCYTAGYLLVFVYFKKKKTKSKQNKTKKQKKQKTN